jgi:hypothetical protein
VIDIPPTADWDGETPPAAASPGTAFRHMASRFFAGVDAAREAELAADDELQAQRRRDFLGGAL